MDPNNETFKDQNDVSSTQLLSESTSDVAKTGLSTVEDSASNSKRQDPPVRIRKKPGRKPNPASPALRKAQNRAAQRAFRERKERHMRELETNVKAIKEQRDTLMHENEKLSSDNEILKAENWYLKGIVLSLQLVCLQHNLSIPQHCPHVNDQTLSVLAQSIPNSIASYMNLKKKNKLNLADKIQQQNSQFDSKLKQQHQQEQSSVHRQCLVTQNNDDLHMSKKHKNSIDINERNKRKASTSNPYLQDMPTLSPISTEEVGSVPSANSVDAASNILPIQTTTVNEPASSNLAALQILRMRLRLQCAKIPLTIRPTLLQLTVPHDPRIDLIPTPQMRDRMILFKDQFDLDDCFRCLLSGSVFHGGDPAVAGNWQLPAEFFDNYWFLTTDYNLRRCTNEWRKKQGLQEIKVDMSPLNATTQSSPQMHVTSSPSLSNPLMETKQYINQSSRLSQQSQSSGTQFSNVTEYISNPQLTESFDLISENALFEQPSNPSNLSVAPAISLNEYPNVITASNSGQDLPVGVQVPFQPQVQPMIQAQGQFQSHSYSQQPQPHTQTQPLDPIQLQNNWNNWLINPQGNLNSIIET
ncbi:hypothetical protein BDF20DRAFT_887364 [Mycotypha africana]|uniref:uncharacterized protein n=1 Tax=Mycotypha africana TaxID=64632 RepID=UPI00230161C4|nr:uncharacterized protein BDF20DRAFT_887364 [Mycotypha africana]KAI8971937.1 hypothetical protein BDF20DRAFT_887364 [Mycotypha africana]